jgi:hypothetical protein
MTMRKKSTTTKKPSKTTRLRKSESAKTTGLNEENLNEEIKNKKISGQAVINGIINKCFPVLGEDIEALSPRDRVNLIKELSKHITPETKRVNGIPGMNIRKITVKIIHTNQDGTEKRD